MGIRVSLWQLPYVPEGSAYFDDLMAVDGFVKNPDGSVHDSKICFTPGFVGITGVIDFTNPAAVKVFQKHIARLLRLGASVIKTDFGEQTPLNGIYHDGSTGRTMHNLYPLLYNQAAYEVTKEVTGEGAVWARSAWAGSQRYPLHWGGDNSPNFHNIIPQITGGLSLGLCGFPFWSQDIGGFCGTTDDLLLIRWMQFGMFLSHSRIHGYGDREIYKFSPEAVHHCREAIRQRYRLMPYILGSAEKCARESLPMARALVIDYQKDRNTWSLADQWLFGESLLVAPVFTADGRRDVYLPEGEWTCWWSGQVRQGGHWITTESPLEHIPIFFREGAVVPMTEPANFVGEKEIQRLEVRITRHTHPGARTSLPLTVHGRPASLEWHLDGPTHQLTYHGPRIELVPLWAGAESGLRVDQKFTDSES
jgi:alpha-D-xyloside xylohydrolase